MSRTEKYRDRSVLMISHSSNKAGGGEDDYQKLMEYFKSKGYKIFSIFPEGYRADYFKSLSYNHLVLPDNIFPFTGFNMRKYIFFLHYSLRKIALLLPYLNLIKRDIDICFINSSVCIPEIISLNILNIPYVLSIKEIANPPFVRKILYRYINRTAKFVVVISEYLKKIVSEQIKIEKLVLIRSSLDEKLCHTIKDSIRIKKNNEFIISVLGVITPIKNQLLLLESLKNIQNIKTIFVNIIGRVEDTAYYHKLKNVADILESKNIKIFFSGEVSRKKALEYIVNSDLVVSTSHYEGMSLVIAEALFFQIPIIATNTGVAAEVIEDTINGYIINDNDTEKLSQLINLLSNNKVLLNKISANQKITYQKYFDSKYYYKEHENILFKND